MKALDLWFAETGVTPQQLADEIGLSVNALCHMCDARPQGVSFRPHRVTRALVDPAAFRAVSRRTGIDVALLVEDACDVTPPPPRKRGRPRKARPAAEHEQAAVKLPPNEGKLKGAAF